MLHLTFLLPADYRSLRALDYALSKEPQALLNQDVDALDQHPAYAIQQLRQWSAASRYIELVEPLDVPFPGEESPLVGDLGVFLPQSNGFPRRFRKLTNLAGELGSVALFHPSLGWSSYREVYCNYWAFKGNVSSSRRASVLQ